jgi:hypothetical protein
MGKDDLWLIAWIVLSVLLMWWVGCQITPDFNKNVLNTPALFREIRARDKERQKKYVDDIRNVR